MLFFFFFFSSRRRHTRLQGDWSSDVCSSDLRGTATDCGCAAMNAFNKSILWSTGLVSVNSTSSFSSSGFAGGVTFVLRSVEGDRVGRAELSAISATLGEGWALTRARDTVEGEPGANAPGTETTA